MKRSKTPSESLAVTTKMVLPNDTNTLGNLFGGQLLAWMDEIAAISAHRHCKRVVVTASINHVAFQNPIKHADLVTIEAKVSRSGSVLSEITRASASPILKADAAICNSSAS